MSKPYAVTPSNTLKPGQMKCFDVNGRRIIVANVAGEFYACQEMCSHEEFPLWYGALKGYNIECSLHGSCFDLRTGKPSEEPATKPVTTYPIKIIDDMLYVVLD